MKEMHKVAIELADDIAEGRASERSAVGFHGLGGAMVDWRIVEVGERRAAKGAGEEREVW